MKTTKEMIIEGLKRFFLPINIATVRKLPVAEQLKLFSLWCIQRTPAQLYNKELKKFLVGVELNDTILYTALFKNQYDYDLSINAMDGARTYPHPNTRNYLRVILDSLTIKDLICVQPMNGPVGLSYYLAYTDQEEEEDGIKNVTLEVLSRAVEAGSRKLRTSWSIEGFQDLANAHNLDVEKEMQFAFGLEVASEINKDWLRNIERVAYEEEPFTTDGNSTRLIIKINQMCNDIATRNRRGAGNKIIVSPMVLSIIQTSSGRNDAPKDMFISSGVTGIFSNLTHVGILNKSIEVYCSLELEDDTILAGYKGRSETDGGLFYTPYHLLMTTGVIVDSETFQPILRFMTRYGKFTHNPENYYTKCKVNVDFTELLNEDTI